MSLPNLSFKEFAKNPIVALLFMSLMVIGYLYLDNKTTLTNQINELKGEVTTLKKEYKELNDKFIILLKEMNKDEK
jgi:predicted RND superfamily exporter protein